MLSEPMEFIVVMLIFSFRLARWWNYLRSQNLGKSNSHLKSISCVFFLSKRLFCFFSGEASAKVLFIFTYPSLSEQELFILKQFLEFYDVFLEDENCPLWFIIRIKFKICI